MPQLLDPNFYRSVVLLIHHDDEGSFGVVINRATDIDAHRLCSALDLEWGGEPSLRIGWGGPVQPQSGWVLFGSASLEAGDFEVREVAPGLHFTEMSGALPELAAEPPASLRLLLGYAGWGAGQLESELAQGAWLLAPVEARVAFGVPLDDMWTEVVRSLGVEPATLVSGRGIH